MLVFRKYTPKYEGLKGHCVYNLNDSEKQVVEGRGK